MHIRIRNNIAQLIRTEYDPETKKGKNTILGKVKLGKPELDDELKGVLTDKEVAEFVAWTRTQAQTVELRRQLAALTLADSMAEAARWFAANGDKEEAPAIAARILGEWQGLRKKLKGTAGAE